MRNNEMLNSRYAVPGAGVVSEAFDGDIVVLDLDSGRYFSFTDSGCALWEALVEGIAPVALLHEGNVYTKDDVEKFVQELIEFRLVAAIAEPATSEVSEAMGAKLSQAKEKLEISVYDDLADLFLFDPIHDVEEGAGWPAVNKA
jgi:hypothetical protein